MKLFFRYLKKYRHLSILAPLFKMAEAALELMVPVVVKNVIDNGIALSDTGYIIKNVVILAALAFAGLVFSITAQYFSAKAAVGFSSDLRADLFGHITRLSFSQLDSSGPSALITRLTSDISLAQNAVNLTLRLLLRSPFVVFGAVIMAFTVDSRCALVFAGAVPMLGAVIFAVMFVTMPLYKKVQGKLDAVLKGVRENLSGVRVLRAFSKENEEISRFEGASETLYRASLFAGKISSALNPATYVILNAAVIALIYIGALRVDKGVMTQGAVVALYNYTLQILVELLKLANLIITISKGIAGANRIGSVFAGKPDMKHPEHGEKPDFSAPAVEFRDVCLRYAENSDDSLTNASFKAEKGGTLGVIGATGSGKSSLIDLIPRFYDVSSGSVSVFGRDVRSYSAETLGELVSVVPQKAVLFSGTVRDNLLMGGENADDDELANALKIAQAYDFVFNKDGLGTVIEQGGRNLSGGQKQRLTIARALVKKAPILILDDSFSALDAATGRMLRDALAGLSYRPLVITVSQRVSCVKDCDNILVLEDGKITAAGKHGELLINSPAYKFINDTERGAK
ncbi:MAG: ABC transporter ATP-binding protein [Clostridia bacterium]|nr:ABC transporter ATP-binding protein [Clostridia bacterium]